MVFISKVLLIIVSIQTQTPTEVEPVQIWPPGELVKVFTSMGKCDKLGLRGRPPRPIGEWVETVLFGLN